VTGVNLFIILAIIAYYINRADMMAPPPPDPYRRERWLAGEPDLEG